MIEKKTIVKPFTPAVLRMSASGIASLLDQYWINNQLYFVAEEAAKSNNEIFHKTITNGFLYYLGSDTYQHYLNPHGILSSSPKDNDNLHLYLYCGLVELVEFLDYHELETINCNNRLDKYIESILEEYEITENNRIGSEEYTHKLRKAWQHLVKINKIGLESLEHEYASIFAERVFHDRQLSEYISRQLQQSEYGWGSYPSEEKNVPSQWVDRKRWPKWLERAIHARDRGKCSICDKSIVLEAGLQNIDHIVPLAHGGTNDLVNLQLTCPGCNSEKNIKIKPVESSIPRYLGIRKNN